MKPLVPVLLVLFLFLFAAGHSDAAELTVTKTADTNDGVCDGDCSLREAVVLAAAGDTVVFSTLFNSPQTITLTLGQINIDKNLTINGTGPTLVTISGNLTGRIFFISGNLNVTMSGMNLRDGKVGTASLGDARGGAIFVANGSGNLDLSNMEFTNNTAYHEPMSFGRGSAVYCFGCTMTLANLNVHDNGLWGCAIQSGVAPVNIRDSILNNNRCGVSADIVNMQNTTVMGNTIGGVGAGTLTLIDSQVVNNTGRGVAAGGTLSSIVTIENSTISGNTDAGLDNFGTATIRNTLISNNQYAGSGAGIINGGNMYVIDSAIIGNSAAQHGGGISTYVGQLFLTNSTVSGNNANGVSSQGLGGGIYVLVDGANPNGRITITNSTISNNQSKGGGGGIRVDSGGIATTRNSIVGGNTSINTGEADVSGAFTSQGNNLIGNTTGSSGWIANDLLNINPLLGPLADNGGGTMTHALLSGSPAIDAGNNSLLVDPQTLVYLIEDQRGFPRLVGALVDIGAYESTQTSSPLIAGSVTYGNSTGSPRFVSGVLINAVTSPNVFATTLGAGPGQGTFLLTGFGSGSQTVTATKTGSVNGSISSFDAGLIARHAAGITPLTGNQLIVADTSGNGTVSSFDAGHVARYAAGLNGFGSSGNWIFIPANRSYPSVTANITGEDFIALLMGEVSGNWMDPGSGPMIEQSAMPSYLRQNRKIVH